jgi:methylmalonyl-CoA/ethylmalonyl-CoA epimerase
VKTYLGGKTIIDHIAIAVVDLEQALFLYQNVFGFELLERRQVDGVFSGMRSAELSVGGFSIVLVQGTGPESQVSRYIERYGPGVQHVAIAVDDVQAVTDTLKSTGMHFATNVIRGDGLIQVFTRRDPNCGMMFEFIERKSHAEGFDPANIQQLFSQLEASNIF